MIISILLQFSIFQTFAIKQITTYLSNLLKTHVEIKKVDISYFDNLVMKGLYVEDYNHDTLLYVNELMVNISNFSIKKQNINLNKIYLQNAKCYLKTDSTGVLNLIQIINAINSDTTKSDTSKTDWKIAAKKIKLNDLSFIFSDYNPPTTIGAMNFSDLNIKNFNLYAKNFNLRGDSIKLKIDSLKFVEKSGFEIKHLSTETYVSGEKIKLDSVQIKTSQSDLELHHIYFHYDSWGSFSDFLQKVKMDARVKDSSNLHFNDLAYFVPQLKPFNHPILLSGTVKGTVSALKLKNFSVHFGKNTHIYTNSDILGLPDINYSFFDIKIDTFATTKSDLALIKSFSDSTKQLITLPQQLQQLGIVQYRGRITGMSKNFVANGKLHSNLGIISTDVKITENPEQNKTNILGVIEAAELEMGILTGNTKTFGNLTLNDTVNIDLYKNGKIKGNIKGLVQNAGINNYDYKNIRINGDFSENTFNGNINIKDPNIATTFIGNIDFSNKPYKFDFQLFLDYAKLYKLNFEKIDTAAMVKFAFKADMVGTSVDDALGKISLNEPFTYFKTNSKLTINNFVLNSTISNYYAGKPIKLVTINSDLLDANIEGAFELTKMDGIVNELIDFYLPSLINTINETPQPALKNKPIVEMGNFFNFEIKLKKIKMFCEFLSPSLVFQDNTIIKGELNSKNNYLVAEMISGYMKIGTLMFSKFQLGIKTQDNKLIVNTGCEKFYLNNDYWIENVLLKTNSFMDTMNINLKWNNKKTQDNYSGNLNLSTILSINPITNAPVFDIKLDNDTIVFKDQKWNIQNISLLIDTTAIYLKEFGASNKWQQISLKGKISEDENDALNLYIKDFELANLNQYLGDLQLGGYLRSEAAIYRVYNKPIITTTNTIRNFSLNKVKLGTLEASSDWIQDSSKIKVKIFTQIPIDSSDRTIGEAYVVKARDTVKFINIEGDYNISNNKINFNAALNNLQLNTFEPYFKDFIKVSQFTAITGNLNVQGTVEKPKIKSRIKLGGGAFIVKYLGTQYDFNDDMWININNNNIEIETVKILTDRGTGIGYLSGNIKHKTFNDINIAIDLKAKNLMFLNRTVSDTADFYGKAYASGDIKVTGKPDNLRIDIQAKTEKNTMFYLPLSSNSVISDNNNFITFVNRDTLVEIKSKEYEVDLSGMKLNFNLEITPDAEIQLIMDETVGDIIKASGSGNLKMEISTSGDFNMYGTLVIEKGDYLFTLKNLFSKKFAIAKGGNIKWNGDPTDANVNLEAVYTLKKVSLYDLVLDDEYRDIKIPVECVLRMTENLMSPNLHFGLNLNNTDDRITSQVKNLDEENLNKQVISLLILNSFQPLPGLKSEIASTASGSIINTGEILSNSLNHWLSQISNQVNIGVNYQTGDEITTDELEVALSTQLWDDRITINSNLGVGGEQKIQNPNQSNANSVVGEVEVEMKINKKGTVKLKAFNKANDNLSYDNAPYTQGVGIFFRKDFDKIGLGDWILKKNKKTKKE